MAYNEDLLRVKKIKEAVYNYRVIIPYNNELQKNPHFMRIFLNSNPLKFHQVFCGDTQVIHKFQIKFTASSSGLMS